MPSRFINIGRGTRGDFGVVIGNDAITGDLSLYFYERRDGRTYAAKPVDLVFSPVDDQEPTLPTIRVSPIFADAFLAALAEALNDAGVKIDKDAKLQGTLDATRFHLEDLRTLLKLARRR